MRTEYRVSRLRLAPVEMTGVLGELAHYTIFGMDLIQIVTGLPPRVDGIGDYALKLAGRLLAEHGIRSAFVVVDPEWQGEAEVEGFRAVKIAARTVAGLIDALDGLELPEAKILVQFGIYGYHGRGVPFWFADALEAWEKRSPGKINVVFHELEVTGAKPWSSGFWVPPFQVAILKRIARVGRFKYTNIELHRGKLEDWGSGRMTLIPNFSTLGEPEENPPFAGRCKDIIVFGRTQQREWTYNRGGEELVKVCRRLGITRIVDIGQPLGGDTRTELSGIPIHRCGRLETAEVNQWMSRALATYTYYPVQFLGKSSVYAVSCAHGAIPIVYDDQPHPHSCPGLNPDEDYVAVPSQDAVVPLAALSATVFRRYQARNSRAAAEKVAWALRQQDQGPGL